MGNQQEGWGHAGWVGRAGRRQRQLLEGGARRCCGGMRSPRSFREPWLGSSARLSLLGPPWRACSARGGERVRQARTATRRPDVRTQPRSCNLHLDVLGDSGGPAERAAAPTLPGAHAPCSAKGGEVRMADSMVRVIRRKGRLKGRPSSQGYYDRAAEQQDHTPASCIPHAPRSPALQQLHITGCS